MATSTLTWILLSLVWYVSAHNANTDIFKANCGVKYVPSYSFFIVGGHPAAEGAWPWQVSLKFTNPDSGVAGHVCGGTLIYNNWVVTAAHCVDGRLNPGRNDPSKYQVITGTNTINMYASQTIGVKRIVPHPEWAFNPVAGFPNDIALMELVQPVAAGGTASPACLPSQEDVNLEGATCWITGWGQTQGDDPSSVPRTLQEAQSPVLSDADCQTKVPLPLGSNHVCVGGGGQPVTCTGDSGGPMSCLVNGSWIIAGVDSWGLGSCGVYPSVMTRVSKYRTWILNTVLQ